LTDPLPLSPGQICALAHAATRELLWGLRAVSREIRTWRRFAFAIPDTPIREDALNSIARKRGHTDGAALFCILPRHRNLELLRMLVSFEIIWDFLDSINERGAGNGTVNGRQLHLALIEALDPDAPISDYYRHHPWRDDGGYLRRLVETCRRGCRALPSYARVRPFLIREATRGQVLALNHDLDPACRDAALRGWAEREFPVVGQEASWFELSGAASASLTMHALLALAAEPACTKADIDSAYAAYFPWLSAATTMLDSYVDQDEDAANGDHSYVAHYSSSDVATRRVQELIARSAHEARRLRNGHRHAVIAACMVAMYLSKDSARTPEMRASTAALAAAGGSLTRLLLPVLRLWRVAYAQRSA
jgi:tetraprenyl-beta-curcumene synthase